jgi:hypothetical protein
MRIRWQSRSLRRLFQVGACVAIPAAMSCEASGARPTGYQVVDSAGLQIVESADPAWDENEVRIEAEPLIRIGREAAGPYQFAFLATGALLEDGHIAVADAGAQEIRVFESSGTHVSTFGGPGDGPGEFRALSLVIDYPGDSVAAFDGRHHRTTIHSTSSGGYRTIQNQIDGNYNVFGHGGSGPFLLYSPGGSFRPDLAPGPQWVHSNIVAMDPDDGSSRVIANLPDRWRAVGPDGNAPMPQPLRYAIQAVAEDGFYWGTPDRYEIRYYDFEGRTRRIIRRPVEPRAVERSMIDRFVEIELARVRRFQGEEAVPAARARYENEQYGEYVPLFQTAFVDDQERLWVGSSEWPSDRPADTWNVFSPAGQWLGQLEAPDDLRIVDVRGSLILGIWHDAFDVPHVQLHRLTGDTEGS